MSKATFHNDDIKLACHLCEREREREREVEGQIRVVYLPEKVDSEGERERERETQLKQHFNTLYYLYGHDFLIRIKINK
jgi:hypothetical protein